MTLADLTFAQSDKKITQLPTLITDELLKESFMEEYEKELKNFKDNQYLAKLTSEGKGSNFFLTCLTNNILNKYGVRSSVPADDKDGKIYEIIKNQFYTDFNALVAQETKPSFEKNNYLWKKVKELAEEKQGSIKFPFMIQGLKLIKSRDKKGYGLSVEPADNFQIFEDDRLSGKYNGWKFSKKDERGLPEDLDRNNGDFTFYTRGDGLSGGILNRNGGLDFLSDDLESSNDDGRVAVFGAGGASSNTLEKRLEDLKQQKENYMKGIESRHKKAERILRGE